MPLLLNKRLSDELQYQQISEGGLQKSRSLQYRKEENIPEIIFINETGVHSWVAKGVG